MFLIFTKLGFFPLTPTRIQRLISHVTHAIETRHIVQEHLEEWSDRAGHAVLVGDAVHVLNVSFYGDFS